MSWSACLMETRPDGQMAVLDLDYYNDKGHGWDMTGNVGPMYKLAFGYPIQELRGRRAEEAAREMERALYNMKRGPAVFKAMNPPNKWGDYGSAMRVLRQMIPVCKKYPEAIFHIQ